MTKSRLEAFSDGVIAIIITIMVLELHPPKEADWCTLIPLIPVIVSYILSFIYLGIYWNNHHHLIHAVKHVTGGALWANLHLLFWLSLVPFATAWMGENGFAPAPVALYGIVLLGAAVAYYVLTRVLLATHSEDSVLAKALGSDIKGKLSLLLYLSAIIVSFYSSLMANVIYWLVAAIWLVPDRRFERHLNG